MKQEISKSGLINNDVSPIIPTTNGSTKPPLNGEKNNNKKKKKGAFSFLKAAIIKLRQRPSEKPKPAAQKEVAAKEKWKKLVGSMRPLHLQDNRSPPPSEPPMSRSSTVENFEDMIAPYSPAPYSPAPSYSTVSGGTMSQYASSSNLQELDKHDGSMSQYASASNLQELDKHDESDEEEDDPDEVFDAIRGDEMIDAKAEEFIAQFYKQMRLQQLNGSHHHHHHKGKDKV